MSDRNKAIVKRYWWAPLLIVVIGIGMFAATLPGEQRDTLGADVPLYTVERGPLTINVLTSGNISAAQAAVVRSEVEGRNQVLYLIEEGTHVEKGDLLVELDASAMEDEKLDEAQDLEASRAALVQAEEGLEIAKQEAKANISSAEVALKLAQIDLEKYTAPEGEYQQQLQAANIKIANLEADLSQAKNTLDWSEKLEERGFITPQELRSDEIDYKKIERELQNAEAELQLLKQYNRERKLAELRSAVTQAEIELITAEHRATSNITEAESDLAAAKLEYESDKRRYDETVAQLAKTKIYAPVPGMVVYYKDDSRWGNDEPLQEGTEVREREELIRLPTADAMLAEVKIHESMVEKVEEGQPVKITTEAVPGKIFNGKVSKVAILPDSQSFFSNPDARVYNTQIQITDDTSGLKPGMSCSAEIVVDHYQDVLYVPIQTVTRVDGEPTVYVKQNGRGVPRQIKVGMDNNRMIHVLDGLKPGEQILLAPPLAESDSEGDEEQAEGGPGGEDGAGGPGGPSGQLGGSGGPEGQGEGGEPGQEQRSQLRERMQNMSEAERQQLREQMQERRQGGPGGGDGSGGRPGGGPANRPGAGSTDAGPSGGSVAPVSSGQPDGTNSTRDSTDAS